MERKNSRPSVRIRSLAESGLIAALYAAATLAIAPLSYGAVQFRAAEALTLLPVLSRNAVWGLTLGCLLANTLGMMLGQTLPVDILFGTLATLVAAIVSRALRNVRIGRIPLLSALAPVVSNALFVGLELSLFFGAGSFAYCAAFVALGEAVVCLLLGIPLMLAVEKTGIIRND